MWALTWPSENAYIHYDNSFSFCNWSLNNLHGLIQWFYWPQAILRYPSQFPIQTIFLHLLVADLPLNPISSFQIHFLFIIIAHIITFQIIFILLLSDVLAQLGLKSMAWAWYFQAQASQKWSLSCTCRPRPAWDWLRLRLRLVLQGVYR